jgi:flavorubredoxin
MKTAIDEIACHVFRICLYPDNGFIAFNHFLILDEHPVLMHLGHKKSFETLLKQVKTLIDPATIRYLAFSHVEADECGALHQWLAVAPHAEVAVGKICAASLKDELDTPLRVLKNNEALHLGQEELILLETPHFPHNWDACLFYTRYGKVLFGSDLGTQTGYREALTEVSPVGDIMALQKKLAYMPYGPHVTTTIQTLKKLDIQLLAAMHGSALNQLQFSHLLDALEQENQH